ncbi:hypothetical protein [Methanococcoides sp. LMO-2]|uniref:Uncharacterized protein n=1 Tax=Methanococcoides cohabitans TaxID=3136559 RepID=A0ABU9KRU7_9EURY
MLFLSWEILARTILATYEVPPFSTIVQVLSLTLVYQLMITLVFSFLELLIILAIGLPLGKLMYTSQRLKTAINPALWFLVFAIGAAIMVNVPILIVLFGLSRLLIFLQSIIVPILVVILISGNGHRLDAIKIGYLLCLFFQIMGEMLFGATNAGIGHMLSWSYYLHDFPRLYSALMLIGLGGMFVEIFIGYIGNKLKIQ